MSLVKAIIKLSWAAALGQFHLATTSLDEIERASQKSSHSRIDNEDLLGECHEDIHYECL